MRRGGEVRTSWPRRTLINVLWSTLVLLPHPSHTYVYNLQTVGRTPRRWTPVLRVTSSTSCLSVLGIVRTISVASIVSPSITNATDMDMVSHKYIRVVPSREFPATCLFRPFYPPTRDRPAAQLFPLKKDPGPRMDLQIANKCSITTGGPGKLAQPRCANPRYKKPLPAQIRCDVSRLGLPFEAIALIFALEMQQTVLYPKPDPLQPCLQDCSNLDRAEPDDCCDLQYEYRGTDAYERSICQEQRRYGRDQTFDGFDESPLRPKPVKPSLSPLS